MITEEGGRSVLDVCEPNSDLVGTEVTAEGSVTGLDRMRPEWVGPASA